MPPRALPLLVAVFFCTGNALAKSAKEVPYTVAECFSAAVRFVRIDRGCKINDKDPEAAFLTWECTEDEKIRRGSLEIFGVGKNVVRLQVTMADEPHYIELRFLELLERKLRDERGTPPPAPSKKPAPPPPDLGASP